MKFSEVTNPQWANAEQTAIDCTVVFDHIGEPVPFTANPLDPLAHGREIFERAAAGEFGPVADYVAPPPLPVIVPVSEDTASTATDGTTA